MARKRTIDELRIEREKAEQDLKLRQENLKKLKAKEVYVPMVQHIGAPAIPIVKVGDEVKENDMIAKAAEGLSVPNFAPITGRVTYVDDKTIVIRA